ncbi:MAG: thiol-disulfide oxidoreductase [Planctomycetaceae bacterium]|nr:thiol-disulfide oxidoreductase [Planctomycetaceae bacterium]
MLPIPTQYPNAEVVIYDGDCQFCRRQVKRLNRWDGKQRLSYISLHDKFVASEYPELTKDEMMQAMYLIDRKGKPHRGAAALRVISRRLPKLWLLALLLHIPFTLPIWSWVYRQIAKRRYRLNCDTGACEIHYGKKPPRD